MVCCSGPFGMRLLLHLSLAVAALAPASAVAVPQYHYRVLCEGQDNSGACSWQTTETAAMSAYAPSLSTAVHGCVAYGVPDDWDAWSSHSTAARFKILGHDAVFQSGVGWVCVAKSGNEIVTRTMYRQMMEPVNNCPGGGTSGSRNFTLGWSRHSADAYPEGSTLEETRAITAGAALAGTQQCIAGCGVTVGTPTKFWHARSPNGEGLYRLSATYQTASTGATCSTTSGEADPEAPSPACVGFKGEINGRLTCVQAVGGPADPSISHPGTPALKGNPAAGGTGTAPLGSTAGGEGASAGGPGRSGDGDFRSGIPSGGGGSGSDPGGEIEIEVKTCGIPGMPNCKIDESGTGDGQGTFEPATQDLDAAAQGLGQKMAEVSTGSGSTSSLPWVPSALSLPTGACGALEAGSSRFGPLSIDICGSPIVALWRQLLGWFVGMGTLLYAWRSAVGTTGGK